MDNGFSGYRLVVIIKPRETAILRAFLRSSPLCADGMIIPGIAENDLATALVRAMIGVLKLVSKRQVL